MASQRNQRGRGNRNRAAGLLAVLVLTSGCANDGRSHNNDPLTGGGPPIPSRAETASSRDDRPAAVAGAPRASVPALPVPSSATSNAALAAGAFQPLDPTRDLRIGNGDPSPAACTWRGPAEGTKTTLNPPQPPEGKPTPIQLTSQPGPVARGDTRPTPIAQPISGAPGASADALFALLQARGVTWHRLETSGEAGEWKYSCSIPNANNPNIRHNYEARDRDPRAAMLAVLKQMDKEQR